MNQTESNNGELRKVFEAFYREHVDAIHGYLARRTQDAELAADLTQRAFMKAYEALPRYRDLGKPYLAYLYRIASNELVSEWRKRGKVKTEELDERIEAAEEKQGVDAALARDLVGQLLPRLSEDFRLVLELRYFAHLEPAEISAMTGWTTNKVGVVHHRALTKLKELVAR